MKATPVATTPLEQAPTTEGPTPVEQKNHVEAPSSSFPAKSIEEIEK